MTAAPEHIQRIEDEQRDAVAASTPAPRPRPLGERLRAALLPMPSGPQEIRALDGLRAVAALSIVAYHFLLYIKAYNEPWSQALNTDWYFLASGVQLFFVLSGFLLFLPYARAILGDRPFPSTRDFYRRRALRILPAYWVCLAIMAVAEQMLRRPVDLGNIITHLLLIHDDFPRYNRALDGPFWTLAVESQFYLLLPLLALIIARVVGGRRSLRRLAAAIGGLIALALALRAVDALVMASLPNKPGADGSPGGIFVLATMGMQGKSLEIFLVGMLAAALYVVIVEQRRLSARAVARLKWALLAVALVAFVAAVHDWMYDGVLFYQGEFLGGDVIVYPLVVGIAYSSFMLAMLLGGRALRVPFEWVPLRFIGLISYSLYLWHLPILQGLVSPFDSLALPLRLLCIVPVAYASYQLVERPFLKRRGRRAPATPAPAARPAAAQSA